MLLISDLHLREETADIVLGKVLPGIFEVAKYKHFVGILGDVFHIRYQVSVRLLNALRDELRRWAAAGIRVTIIPGNHDQIDVEGRNALETLGDIDNVSVYTVPTWDGDGLWVPYRKAELVPGILQQALDCYPQNSPKVLFIHHGIKGAWMNDGYQDPDGINVTTFDGFDAVLCGHYHKHQEVGPRATYIGSPYQVDAGESGQEKGYCIWDNYTLTFVPQKWGPRYHRLILEPGGKIDTSGIDSCDDVRVETATAEDAAKVGAVLAGLGVARHTVTPRVEAVEARLQPANESLESYARAYAETVAPAGVSPEKLMEVFAEITQ